MIRAELSKQAWRPRTALVLVALAGFGVVLTAALGLTGPETREAVGDIPLLLVPGRSGFSVPVIALTSTMKLFLPLAVSIFAGEAVAGEARWGSLRYALARGVPRGRLLASKAAVAGLLSLVAVALVPLTAAAAGLVAYGWHPLTAVDGGGLAAGLAAGRLQQARATFEPAEAIAVLTLGTAYVGAGAAAVFAFAFFLSTVTARPLVAVAGGVGLAILARLLNYDYLPGVAVLAPYLPDNDVDLWLHLLQRPAATDGMGRFLVVQAIYAVVFLTAAWWSFRRRDVLS